MFLFLFLQVFQLTNNRLLELNSWQLLRLLEVQLPGLVCENFLCDDFRDDESERTRGYSSLEETICCLSACEDNCYSTLVAAYYNFLRTASSYDATLMAQIVYVVLAIVAAARKLNACTISLPASIWHSSGSNQHRRQWVEVAALYYMGMAGHFGLGNTNALATIDVAGAFIVRFLCLILCFMLISHLLHIECLEPLNYTFWCLNVHYYVRFTNVIPP
ncbi:hypothetical protein KY290_008033 [Solanum tuberosum]|uniref:Uncharacterized protein n=1 Tax=Solanum tuberosum TaxID=4113 RepID=A0ABQ7W7A4_SOLTU|nr:hypothetical protein KY290_008033 [Solanum tuberosum]